MPPEYTRRTMLRATGAAVATGGALARTVGRADARTSPDLAKYVQPLPRPDVRDPDGKRKGATYYDIPLVEFSERLHPDLPATTLWGYDGEYPGPIIQARRNERLKLRFDNSRLPSEHLLSVDDRIDGTRPEDYPNYDGPVPAVRTVTHVHGLNVEPESDGQAEMWTSPGGVTGPRFEKHVQDVPNRQARMTSSYHDHALGISRLNNYAGLNGFYFITSSREERLGLPSGEYDVPLMLHDRSFEPDGSLHYPDSFVANVAGDTAVVNGAVWPYLEVEPRRYRLRFVNTSNGRVYDMRLENDSDDEASVPTLHQFAAGHGFLERVVPIGPNGDLESLVVAPFERGDVVVDFSDHAGETFTVTNHAEFPFAGGGHDEGGDDGHGGSGPALGELFQIRVTESSGSVTDDSADPTSLTLPSNTGPTRDAARETRQMEMTMTRDEYGLAKHLLNDGGSTRRRRSTRNSGRPRCGKSRTRPCTPTRSTFTWCGSRYSAAGPTAPRTPRRTSAWARTPSASTPARRSASWSSSATSPGSIRGTVTSSNTRTTR